MLTNLRDKLPVFSDWTGGVTGIMLPLGFLSIVSVVLGVRNRRCQPKCKAAGWLAAPQHVFLHSDTASSPTVVFFALGMLIPRRAAAWGCFVADGDGKENFNCGSPDWERSRSSTGTGWLSPGSTLQLCPLQRLGLLALEGC